MSLEAMKQARQIIWRYRHETPLGNQPHMIAHEADETIERIDQAIAEAEKQDPVAHQDWCIGGDKGPCNCEKQEPVAWRWIPSEVWGTYVLSDDLEKAELAKEHGIKVEPLYTHPQPKHEWVGLTDEDIEEIWGENLRVMYSGNIEATKAIEAKLKQKNGIKGEA